MRKIPDTRENPRFVLLSTALDACFGHRRGRSWFSQLFMAIAAITISACSYIPGVSDEEEGLDKGTVGYVQGFFGGVAADEPQAVLIARDVLAAGGTAGDAAVALYFMLSVTYPSAAGLGGGGICLARDPKTNSIETLDFLSQTSTGKQGVRVNVPGNPRGFFALHAKYGNLTWAEMIRPAEQAARFGTQISRAFAKQVEKAPGVFAASAEAREIFNNGQGGVIGEGSLLKQQSLSTLLARIRSRGGGTIYSGPFARQFAQAAQDDGAALTYEDLRSFKPIWRGNIEVPFVNRTALHFLMPRTQAGTMAAKSMALAIHDKRYAEAEENERGHLVAEVTQRALVDGGKGFAKIEREDGETAIQLSGDYIESLMSSYHDDRVVRLVVDKPVQLSVAGRGGETSFTVVDRKGGVVVCSLTMNGTFGSGRMARGLGVFLANPAGSFAERDLSLGGFIVISKFRKRFFMAGAASGGAAAQSALAQVALRAGAGTKDSLETAMARKRLFRNPATATTEYETGLAQSELDALRRRGHDLKPVEKIGAVNLAICETGLPAKIPVCGIRTDPRGFGLATSPGS